ISGPRAELFLSRKLVPAWAIRLVVGTLILPALIAVVDGFARVRRRRHPVGRWLVWTLAGAAPFVVAWLFSLFLELPGLLLLAPELRLRRGLQVFALALALAPFVLIAAYYAIEFRLSLPEVPWTALLLVVGGGVGLPAVLAWCVGLGVLGDMLAIMGYRA